MNGRRLPRLLAAALTVTLLPAGCGLPDVADLPLPGGEPSGDSYTVTAEFSDVLDLVPQAAVKVDDVTVGSVEKISLSGWHARVRLRIDRSVQLPANATAAVRQSSLLGEKYVTVDAPPTEAARGRLADRDLIPLSRTSRGAEVEEVLAALGLLLNGGGLAQLRTINQELAKALDGREPALRDTLAQLDTFIGGLDRQKTDIVRAIEALDRLTGRLSRQRQVVSDALDSLAPGLTVLAQQRRQLTEALTALGKLGEVGTQVVNRSREDTVASVRALQPILEQLARAGDNLPKSLEFMLSYPFPPNVEGAIVGDFVNLKVTADLDAASILSNLVAAAPPPARQAAPKPPAAPRPPATPGAPGGTPTLPGLPGLPELPLTRCLPDPKNFPATWTPPEECGLPVGCVLLRPGSTVPVGGLLVPTGVVPAGTAFPAGTKLPRDTVLSADCLLPVTGAVTGQVGELTDILGGGLLR